MGVCVCVCVCLRVSLKIMHKNFMFHTNVTAFIKLTYRINGLSSKLFAYLIDYFVERVFDDFNGFAIVNVIKCMLRIDFIIMICHQNQR